MLGIVHVNKRFHDHCDVPNLSISAFSNSCCINTVRGLLRKAALFWLMAFMSSCFVIAQNGSKSWMLNSAHGLVLTQLLQQFVHGGLIAHYRWVQQIRRRLHIVSLKSKKTQCIQCPMNYLQMVFGTAY